MFMDLWVATDGIITVRFPDRQSAKIYCAETGWNESDLFIIRQQVTVEKDGAITVEPWRNRMDPNVDCENAGTWQEDVYLPPQHSMINPADYSEDDQPVIVQNAYLRKLGEISYRLGWGFRDLAARTPDLYQQVVEYVAQCDFEHRKPNLQEIEKIVGVYAN